MNGVSAESNIIFGNNSGNKGNQGNGNKSNSIIHWCFIYNSMDHKIYDYPHKETTHVMFRGKTSYVCYEYGFGSDYL